MTSILKYPSDLERLEASRRFIRKLQVATEGVMTAAEATLCVYQTWAEWATAAVEWRALRGQVQDAGSFEWTKEEVTHMIESFCVGFKGVPGKLIMAAIESNFMVVERRGETDGLILTGFWALNDHLDPNHKSIQSQGGHARAEKRRIAEIAKMGEQTRKLQEAQGNLVFGSAQPTKEEQDQVYTLIIRIDRACEKPARLSREYTEALLQRGLEIVRTFEAADFLTIESYLVENRQNPAVVKVTDQVIERFGEYLEAARQNG